jgi:hypothetical protein
MVCDHTDNVLSKGLFLNGADIDLKEELICFNDRGTR